MATVIVIGNTAHKRPRTCQDARCLIGITTRKVATQDGQSHPIQYFNNNEGIMNKQLVEKLLEILLQGDSEATPSSDKEMIGDYVIVRCRDAGVHAGTLKSYEGREVVLKNSRRLWFWKCANNKHSLSGVAAEGITGNSKITDVVTTVVLPEACEILSTSRESQRSIEDAEVYTAS